LQKRGCAPEHPGFFARQAHHSVVHTEGHMRDEAHPVPRHPHLALLVHALRRDEEAGSSPEVFFRTHFTLDMRGGFDVS
jgi:hypothetical protein